MTGYESKKNMAQDKITDEQGRPMTYWGGKAQPAQEPVAWMYDWLCDGKLITGWIAHSESEIPKSMAFNIRPLYTAPPQLALEPVAWMYPDALCDRACLYVCTKAFTQFPECATTPPQPAQKPKSFTYNEVADAMNSFRKGNSVQKAYAEEVGKLKLYAAPPQRPWVELEGEEIRNLWEEATKPDRSTVTMVTSFARAIEAKLKEKNT